MLLAIFTAFLLIAASVYFWFFQNKEKSLKTKTHSTKESSAPQESGDHRNFPKVVPVQKKESQEEVEQKINKKEAKEEKMAQAEKQTVSIRVGRTKYSFFLSRIF